MVRDRRTGRGPGLAMMLTVCDRDCDLAARPKANFIIAAVLSSGLTNVSRAAPVCDTCCWGTGAFGGISMFTGVTGYRWCDTMVPNSDYDGLPSLQYMWYPHFLGTRVLENADAPEIITSPPLLWIRFCSSSINSHLIVTERRLPALVRACDFQRCHAAHLALGFSSALWVYLW